MGWSELDMKVVSKVIAVCNQQLIFHDIREQILRPLVLGPFRHTIIRHFPPDGMEFPLCEDPEKSDATDVLCGGLEGGNGSLDEFFSIDIGKPLVGFPEPIQDRRPALDRGPPEAVAFFLEIFVETFGEALLEF